MTYQNIKSRKRLIVLGIYNKSFYFKQRNLRFVGAMSEANFKQRNLRFAYAMSEASFKQRNLRFAYAMSIANIV